MDTVELVVKAATKFYDEVKSDENGRYRSWEHCYYSFYKARKEEKPDIDYLSLQLAFYLASWGMYRGSSFLLHKDYKIHIPVVNEVLKSQYNVLFGAACERILEQEYQRMIQELSNFLVKYYNSVREEVKGYAIKENVSATLITKVLMGTLGCVPAYDRYFIAGIKSKKVATGIYNPKSLSMLAEFYRENMDKFEEVRKGFVIEDILYPQMKLLDMGFWQLGEEQPT